MDYRSFMRIALEEARAALAQGEFPVGCVCSRGQTVLTTGSRKNSKPEARNEFDHAEMLALKRLVERNPPVPMDETCLFTTLEPCLMCFSALIVNGVKTVVYAYEDVFGGGTTLDLKGLKPFYRSIDIEIISGVLREESLELFRAFFSDPANSYLDDTPLARQVLREFYAQ